MFPLVICRFVIDWEFLLQENIFTFSQFANFYLPVGFAEHSFQKNKKSHLQKRNIAMGNVSQNYFAKKFHLAKWLKPNIH